MKLPEFETAQIELIPSEPELYIPSIREVYGDFTNEQDDRFYNAAYFVIQACVNKIPVVDEEHPYHDRGHTIDVVQAFSEIGIAALRDEKITSREFMLGLIACSAHDLDYEKTDKTTPEKNEKRSTRLLFAVMEQHEVFEASDYDTVEKCIDATVFEGMDPETGEILQRSSDYILAQLVTDADVCNLAMVWSQAIAQFESYFLEDRGVSVLNRVSKAYLEFLEMEVRTLRAHSFKTSYAELYWNTVERGLEVNARAVERIVQEIRQRISSD